MILDKHRKAHYTYEDNTYKPNLPVNFNDIVWKAMYSGTNGFFWFKQI
jgi:hypothetical protein